MNFIPPERFFFTLRDLGRRGPVPLGGFAAPDAARALALGLRCAPVSTRSSGERRRSISGHFRPSRKSWRRAEQAFVRLGLTLSRPIVAGLCGFAHSYRRLWPRYN